MWTKKSKKKRKKKRKKVNSRSKSKIHLKNVREFLGRFCKHWFGQKIIFEVPLKLISTLSVESIIVWKK